MSFPTDRPDGRPKFSLQPHGEQLHRLRVVREREGVSLRSVARKLGRTVTQIRDEEQETTDLRLSVLYRWQQVLGVPVAELLVPHDDPLSPSIRTRSRLLKIMKTVRTLEQHTRSPESAHLIRQLAEQLLELMPELRDVSGWQGTGHRRTLDELGRIADNPFPEQFLMDTFEV